jgi:hypothetical protein
VVTTDPIATVLDAAEIDERYQPTRTRATICMDSELVLRIGRLEQQIAETTPSDSAADPVAQLAEEALELREQAKAAEVEFVFRSIGRLAKRDLIREHPPTKEQTAELGEGMALEFNPLTYPPALLAASCESVRNGTVAWWTRKLDEWGDGQVARLWQACTAAQDGVNDTPKAAQAFAATRRLAESSG